MNMNAWYCLILETGTFSYPGAIRPAIGPVHDTASQRDRSPHDSDPGILKAILKRIYAVFSVEVGTLVVCVGAIPIVRECYKQSGQQLWLRLYGLQILDCPNHF